MLERGLRLLENPYLLLGIAFALCALLSASVRRWQFLYIAAAFAVLVSITPPTILDPSAYIGLWGPLESLRVYNRYFAVAGGLAIVAAMRLSGLRATGPFPMSAGLLLITHAIILVKNLIGTDDPLYAVLLFVAFLTVVLLYWNLFSAAADIRGVIYFYLRFLAGVGIFFVLLNLGQFLINRSATFVVGGRFHGITNNPQMFVISIAPLLPLAFFVAASAKPYWVRCAAILSVVCAAYWIYLTGSRLGILLSAIAVVSYYQLRGKELLFALAVVVVIYGAISFGNFSPSVDLDARSFSTVDTRTQVWKAQISQFLENPVFGKDHGGARVSFGESTWLGAASGLGLAGLVPMLLLGGRTAWLATRIWSRPGLFSSASEKSVVLAVVAVALAGSFFEAFLFGVLTLPVIIFLSTVLVMERLVYLATRQGRLQGSYAPGATRRSSTGVRIVR